jgi:putative copper resistance protein D
VEVAAPLVRWLLYTGATLSIGRGVLTFLDRDADDTASRSRTVRSTLWMGAIALIIAPLALLALQQQALELPAADIPALLRDTTWGRGWTKLAIPCALTAVLLPWRPSRTMSLLLLMAALSVAAAMGGLGHAAADDQWPLASRLFDAIHVAGVGAWIGGLLLLVLASVGGSTPTVSAWRAFSRTATVMAPVVLLSGVGSTWRRVGASGPTAILASDYGKLLLFKIVLALAVLAMGFTQRRRMAAGQIPVRRLVLGEVVLAAAILGATAWMTGTEPPGE